MPALDAFARDQLAALEQQSLLRAPTPCEAAGGATVTRHGKTLISFSSNDYFGLSRHPDVIATMQQAAANYGAGAGASRLVTGEHTLYGQLENTLARQKNTEAACIFGSGYLANTGTIPALVGKGDLILADKLIHACMVDGAQLSGASFKRFAHNDMAHLEQLLQQHRNSHTHCLILTETVFSMDGDCAPLADIMALAERYNAWVMSDDAHGLGITASPTPAHIQMGTLSKAAGNIGGYVCASAAVIHLIKSTARSLIYTTALPAPNMAAAQRALEIIESDPELRAKPLRMAQHFTQLLNLPMAQSTIVPLILGEADQALAASKQLEEEGFLVSAIRPPTVPPRTARLRFAFSALHETHHIEQLVKVIKQHGWA